MDESIFTKEISTPLFQAKGWMKLLGVISIISGVLLIFTIVGILFCWLPIWMGVLLFQAGNKVEVAQSTGDKLQLIESLTKLKTYFMISGILVLIALVGGLITALVSGGAIFGILNSLSR